MEDEIPWTLLPGGSTLYRYPRSVGPLYQGGEPVALRRRDGQTQVLTADGRLEVLSHDLRLELPLKES